MTRTLQRTTAAVALGATLLLPAACSSGSKGASNDVKITACAAGGKPDASGSVTNHTKKASTYVIRVRFDDADGNRVSTGVASLRRVDAGATEQWHVAGVIGAKGKIDCKIAGVTRTVSP